MSNKKKSEDLGLGDFMGPLIDVLSIIFIKLCEFLVHGLIWLVNKYIFNDKQEEKVKKIERDDLKNKKTTLNEEALGYSISQKRDINISEVERKKHTLICGASGFGKTVLLDGLMFDDMKQGKSVIFFDPKGDNKSLEQFINLCKIAGRDYQIFSEYYESPKCVSLNPVKEGSATHIADRIHYSFNWSEEHYEVLCHRALKKACSLLKNNGVSLSYSAIIKKLIEISDPKNKEKLFDRKNIEGILARLESIVDSDFGDKLKHEGLSFKEIWDSKKCVYIGLPVLGYPRTARSLGKCFLGDLAYSVYEAYKNINVINENKLIPAGVYIDEISAIITDEFIELLNKCRGVKMEMTYAFQSPSDINKLSPELCEQMLENTSNWFILKQRIEKGVNTFAEAIGTVAGHKETMKVEAGKEQDQGSQRIVEELIAHHNIIKSLREGQGVLLRHSPARVDLINFKYINPLVAHTNVKFLEREGFIKKDKLLVNQIKEVEKTIL